MFIQITDIPGSHARNELFCLKTMYKVKHKDLESGLSRTGLFYKHNFAILNLETYDYN